VRSYLAETDKGSGFYSPVEKVLQFSLKKVNREYCVEGVQNKPPQNVLIWHVDYFELKIIKAQQSQEKLFTTS